MERTRPQGRIAYVDGRYLPHAGASVHIEDRGLQFADAVYEVCSVNDGLLLDETGHLDRLERSLKELAIAMPMRRAALMAVMREVMRRNRLKDGLIYLQVTRGAYEAWLVDTEGFITEGASTNAWIVTKKDVLVTRDLKANILAGVTRKGVLAALSYHGINAIEERAFTLKEANDASEAFITSASGGVIPVVKIDGHAVGTGRPGPMAARIHALYRDMSLAEAKP